MSLIPNYVPSGLKTINLLLVVNNVERALEWYNRAFGAEETMGLRDNNGRMVHAEMKIADTTLRLTEKAHGQGYGPDQLRGTSVIIQIYTPDVEAFFAEAMKFGAKIVSSIGPKFYGDRSGTLIDPFGHQWVISTHMEDLTAAELQRRFQQQIDTGSLTN